MDMKKYQILYKCFLLIIAFFIFKNVGALETSLFNKEQGNIYIIGSNLGYELNNIDKYEFISLLEKKHNIINLSIRDISIYDQLDLFEEIPILHNDKIIILLENFYLESILFEINYIKNLCNINKKKCKKIDLVQYKDIYLPLIEILHSRLEDFFSFNSDNTIIFLVDNTDFYHSKYNLKLKSNDLKISYFTNKDRYCLISDINNLSVNNFHCLQNYIF